MCSENCTLTKRWPWWNKKGSGGSSLVARGQGFNEWHGGDIKTHTVTLRYGTLGIQYPHGTLGVGGVGREDQNQNNHVHIHNNENDYPQAQ